MKMYERFDAHINVILTTALVGGQCQLHARPLYPRGIGPRFPLDRRLGGPQSRFEQRGEE
jgi:hypothetical protein